MNLALFGYGKMGRAIEKIALERGHTIVLKTSTNTDLQAIDLKKIEIDVALDFSSPLAASKNIKFCLDNNIPIVCGTTGWLDQLSEIEELTKASNGAFFYTSNFSLGVNLFFKLNKYLANLIGNQDYSVRINEIHHTEKIDAPSGTAITLAEDIIESNSQLNTWVNNESTDSEVLSIISHRVDEVPGIHRVKYQGVNDDIIIEHVAKNRDGFALGTVVVAEWILGKKGVLGMDDFLK